MKVTRFPVEDLSADYGDIIIESVADTLEAIISIGDNVILHEVYSADLHGKVYIRDVGTLAMVYNNINNIQLTDGIDGSSILLHITLKEGEETFSNDIRIYCCDAETGDSLAVSTLKRMPLSRAHNKVTGIGRTEYLSFYGNGKITVDVLYYGQEKDELKSIELPALPDDKESYFRYNVSPAIIAQRCNISESKLIQYSIFKNENDMLVYKMERRAFLNQTTFVFKNIFGAQETFTCVGDAESERKWTREYGFINGNQIQTSRVLNHLTKINTGFINRSMIGVLEDLLNSNHVYIIEDGMLRQVSIMEETCKISSRKDQLIAFDFKYRVSSNNQLQYRSNKKRIFDYTFDSTFN